MTNERITDPNMTMEDLILHLAGGNPGAFIVCTKILTQAQEIDPDAAMGGFIHLLHLDSMNIWEERIWVLYKYVCGEDLKKMIAVIRACQLGGLVGMTREAVQDAIQYSIDNRSKNKEIDLDAVVAAVKQQLPNFSPTTH